MHILIDQSFLTSIVTEYIIHLSDFATCLPPLSLPVILFFSSMGFAPARILCYRNRHVITFFLFLLITSWKSPVKIVAEGRAIPKLKIEGLEANEKKVEEKVVMVMRSLIGSRPPRCESRCRSCGHCEAVQVPIAPSLKHQQTRSHQFFSTPTIAYSRGDDISNYKPMCWKCKCGSFIFNP